MLALRLVAGQGINRERDGLAQLEGRRANRNGTDNWQPLLCMQKERNVYCLHRELQKCFVHFSYVKMVVEKKVLTIKWPKPLSFSFL